jgi:hypothetical protein
LLSSTVKFQYEAKSRFNRNSLYDGPKIGGQCTRAIRDCRLKAETTMDLKKVKTEAIKDIFEYYLIVFITDGAVPVNSFPLVR